MRRAWRRTEAQDVLRRIQKVKAHQHWENMPEGANRAAARGNDMADKMAKQARSSHPQPSDEDLTTADYLASTAMKVAAMLGKASARWPAAGQRHELTEEHQARVRQRRQEREERRKTQHLQQSQAQASHQWVASRGIRRCRQCWRRPGPAAGGEVCPGLPPALVGAAAAAVRENHKLWIADVGHRRHCDRDAQLLACIQCGAWSLSGKSALFRQPCTRPSASGSEAISRMRRALFPKAEARYRDAVLLDPVPFSASGSEPAVVMALRSLKGL